MARITRLSDAARGLEKTKFKDYDPEDNASNHSEEEHSGSDEDASNLRGREHYESVSKSKLRKPEKAALGAKYGGVAVCRKALEESDDQDNDPFAPIDGDDDDDPFAAKNGDVSDSDLELEASLAVDSDGQIDDDDEIDSDEALGESDLERFKDFTFRGSRSNQKTSEETSSEESDQEEHDSDIEADTQASENSGESDVDMEDADTGDDSDQDSMPSSTSSPPPSKSKPARNTEREELRKAAFSSASTAGLASALSAGAAADIKKGQAVKKQQQAFDRLLDARIKLQKGLTAANDLADSSLTDAEVATAAQQAESAALTLWSTINSIRHGLLSAQQNSSTDSATPLKRKRPSTASRTTPSSTLLQETTLLDSQASPTHRTALDKWHVKTQPAIDATARSKLLGPSHSSQPSRLTDILTTYLSTTSASLISSSTSPTTLYDDATFYQSLLRDLIASRAANDSSLTSAIDTYLPPKLHASGSRNKKVDTKASKGRKIRYTVHEKLQNFMAPEDRGTWEESARREFFASLFGKSAVLDEGDGGSEDDVEDSDDGLLGGHDHAREDVALRLFRS